MAQKDTVEKALLVMILFLYPGLCTRIFTMLRCSDIPGVGRSLDLVPGSTAIVAEDLWQGSEFY